MRGEPREKNKTGTGEARQEVEEDVGQGDDEGIEILS